jgi:hypothetical protein
MLVRNYRSHASLLQVRAARALPTPGAPAARPRAAARGPACTLTLTLPLRPQVPNQLFYDGRLEAAAPQDALRAPAAWGPLRLDDGAGPERLPAWAPAPRA